MPFLKDDEFGEIFDWWQQRSSPILALDLRYDEFGEIFDWWQPVPSKEQHKDDDKKEGTCPKCQHAGTWVRMALVCPTHGMFAGC